MKKISAYGVLVFILLAALLVIMIQRMPRMHMFEGPYMPLRLLAVFGFWILIFLIVLGLINTDAKKEDKTAQTILTTRLAKGEISIEEFETLNNKIKEKQK